MVTLKRSKKYAYCKYNDDNVKRHVSIHYIQYLMIKKKVTASKVCKFLDRPIEEVRVLLSRGSASCVKKGEPVWEKIPNEKLELIRWLEDL